MNSKERPAAIEANQMLAAAFHVSTDDGNKVIAEFMGYKYFQSSYGGWGFCKDEKDMSTWLHSNNIFYHSSWDWLMPVIEKIENLWIGHSQPRCKIEGTYCQIADSRGYYAKNSNLKKDHQLGGECYINNYTKLENTYRMVVEFINWYNEWQLSKGSC